MHEGPRAFTWFHAMNRVGKGRELLRREGGDSPLVALIGTEIAEAGHEVHAYCLLDRHYHLLTRGDRSALPDAIASFEAASERRLGRAGRGGGPLFPQPARIVPVSLGRPLGYVSRYLHLNPVRAGLAWEPEEWPYSTLRAYLGDPGAPSWVRTAAILGAFGSIGARLRYRAFVREGLDPGARDGVGRPRWGAAFPRGSLAEDLAWRVEPIADGRPAPSPDRPIGGGPSLEALARAVARELGVPVEAVRSWRGGGGREAARARGALVQAARSLGSYRLREVAAWMRYASPTAAVLSAARFDRAARDDPSLEEALRRALRPFEERLARTPRPPSDRVAGP